MSLGNELEAQTCFRQTQPMGNHLTHRHTAGMDEPESRRIIGRAAGIGSSQRYVSAPEEVK